jgi:cell division protein FtsB
VIPAAPQPFWKRHLREILLVALAALAIHDVFGTHGFLAMWRTQQQLKALRADLDRLNRENQKLSDQVSALRTDPKAIERIAREQMGLARPGEMIFKLPSSPAGNSSSPNSR